MHVYGGEAYLMYWEAQRAATELLPPFRRPLDIDVMLPLPEVASWQVQPHILSLPAHHTPHPGCGRNRRPPHPQHRRGGRGGRPRPAPQDRRLVKESSIFCSTLLNVMTKDPAVQWLLASGMQSLSKRGFYNIQGLCRATPRTHPAHPRTHAPTGAPA